MHPADRFGHCHPWVYAAGEPALVQEVEEFFRRPGRHGPTVAPEPTSRDCAELSPTDLLRYLNEPSVDVPARLLILRRADAADPLIWGTLASWRVDRPSAVTKHLYVLATGLERWNPRADDDPRHPVFVRKHPAGPQGVYVDCRPLDRDQQVRFVQARLSVPADEVRRRDPRRRLSIMQGVAETLVDRCGGDLRRLVTEVRKLALLNGAATVTREALDAVVVPSPGEQFVQALLEGRVADAVRAAPQVGSLRFVLGSLDWHLSTLFSIRQVIRDHRLRSVKDISEHAGLEIFVVMRLRRLARTYDLVTVRRRYAALVRAGRLARETDRPEHVLIPLASTW